jgi:hypothetical protein
MDKMEVKFFSQPDLSHLHGEHDSGSDIEDSEEDLFGQSASATLKLKHTRQMLIAKNKKLCNVLDKVDEGVRSILTMNCQKDNRHIDPNVVDKDDFDCSLCFRLLWHPVTTPCGHTYCKSCIDRSVDHKRECPLCKTTLKALHRANMVSNLDFIQDK